MSMCTLLLLGGIGAATALSCGDPAAQNFLYRADGLFDSALCAYEPVYYCNDPTATNYQSAPSESNRDYFPRLWACTYNIVACMDPTADNYYSRADTDDRSKCTYGGCTNPDASNYDPSVRPSLSLPNLHSTCVS
mmetsp:Transcript_8048/g.24175  ORF Transcript_8048/g.24175 Transcript_8048/m.24175 type:complete len:135 (-) Transcript_8048:599-1003(-)